MKKIMRNESEGYEILKKRGVPVPEHRVVNDAGAAAEAAKKNGFPVVMKILSPQVVHKSDAGGVIANIGDADAAEKAYNTIIENVGKKVPDAEITGIAVEKMMPGGLGADYRRENGSCLWESHYFRPGGHPGRTHV